MFAQVCAFVRSSAAHLFVQDAVSRAANSFFACDNPDFTRSYIDKIDGNGDGDPPIATVIARK